MALAEVVSVALLEIVQYAKELQNRLRRISRTAGRRDIRLELGMAYNAENHLLRKQTNALWRDVPRLFARLGGNPSDDLFGAPKQRSAASRF